MLHPADEVRGALILTQFWPDDDQTVLFQLLKLGGGLWPKSAFGSDPSGRGRGQATPLL